jgi:hypothetical protein
MLRNSGVNHLETQKKNRYLKMGGIPQGPQTTGLEYDSSVPDGIVIGSPGGTSSTYHHYTKGMYGTGAVSNDIYGGDAPRYLYGEYGNMYEMGDSAAYKMGAYMQSDNRDLDPTYWKNQYPQSVTSYEKSKNKTYSSQYSPEYDGIENFELIDTPDDIQEPFTAENKTYHASVHGLNLELSKPRSPILTFAVFLVVYITLSLWAMFIMKFLSEKFNNGKDLNGWKLFICAGVFTLIMIIVLWIFDIPLVRFTELQKNPFGANNENK